MTSTRESHTMDQPSSDGLPPSSRSAMFLQATQFVADLHQRASLNTPAMLRELLEGAATSVPGAQYAGITVTEKRRRSQTAAATHRYPVMLDEIQSRHQRGPCLTAAALHDTVHIDDLDADNRWPLFREEALKKTPIRSILSFGMFREGASTAALNFYTESVGAFDDGSVNLGLIFATHTALVWTNMRRDQQFRSAIVSRDIIGQAKGRLMERFDIDADAAFEMLKQMSQESNTPITQIAQRIVTGGRPLLLRQPR
jgi:ANTAR domain-containing protein/GAF domain-containing protein